MFITIYFCHGERMKKLFFLFALLLGLVGCGSWITSVGQELGSGMAQGAKTEVSDLTTTAVDAGAGAVMSAITNPDNIARVQDTEKKLGQPLLDTEKQALDNGLKAEDSGLAKALAAEKKLAAQAQQDVKNIISAAGTELGAQWDSVLVPRIRIEEQHFADTLNTSIKNAFSGVHSEIQDVKSTVTELRNDIIIIMLIGGGILLSIIIAFGLVFHSRLNKLERAIK